ncbi:MAG: hypothetical protein COB04_12170 [Gammaproteobacteria bacterium]|nr:MAG: hypothetical protein COB04_12170 [Gammaproteobacteria bacterium]
MNKTAAYLVIILTLSITGCSQFRFPGVFKIDVGQGNIVESTEVEQLRIGMSERQVKFLLGSPLIQDIFHPDRWDYFYSLKKGKEGTTQKRLTIYFKEGKLDRIEGDFDASNRLTQEATPKLNAKQG